MDDALVPKTHIRLLPRQRVLILVVMDDALAQDGQEDERETRTSVLILVLMEDALAQE